jgi:hypothetical protein
MVSPPARRHGQDTKVCVRPDPLLGWISRVAVILYTFTELALRFEWTQVTFGPDGWAPGPRSQPAGLAVSSSPPGMGTPTAGRLHMTRASGPSKKLHALVAWCRETRNPTAFWNKEDTPNYAGLIETAKLFDHMLHRRRIANHLYRLRSQAW